jgi:4-amino-4-deoxy-L-arabinose transferase-like glycosyltransferase
LSEQNLTPTKYLALLVLLLIPLFFLGISNRGLWGTDEPRVVEVSREMALTGNWAVPTLNQRPFLEEPPLYYASVALTFKVLGVSDRVARIPSAFFGLGGAIALFFLTQMFFGAKLGFLSAFVLATSFEYAQIAHFGIVDSALTCFIIAAMTFFVAGYRSEDRKAKIGYYAAMYFFCTLAFYSKGFIGIAIPGLAVLTFLVFDKNLKEILRMRLWLGVLIFIAATLPWFVALWLQGGTEHLRFFFIDNHVMRFLKGGDLGHHHPFYYYLTVFPPGFFPWTLILLMVLYRSFSIPAETPGDARRGLLFAKSWFVSGFVLFSLASSKRLLYLLPIFAPLAVLTGFYIDYALDARRLRKTDKLFIWMFGVFLLAIGAAAVPIAARNIDKPALAFTDGLPPAVIAFSILAVGLSLVHLWFLIRKNMARFWFAACGTIWALLVFLLVALVPVIDGHRNIAPFCKQVKAALGPATSLYGYKADETLRGVLPFYTGRYLKEVATREHLEQLLATDEPLFIAVRDDDRKLERELLSTGNLTVVVRQEMGRHRSYILLTNKARKSG